MDGKLFSEMVGGFMFAFFILGLIVASSAIGLVLLVLWLVGVL